MNISELEWFGLLVHVVIGKWRTDGPPPAMGGKGGGGVRTSLDQSTTTTPSTHCTARGFSHIFHNNSNKVRWGWAFTELMPRGSNSTRLLRSVGSYSSSSISGAFVIRKVPISPPAAASFCNGPSGPIQ